MKVSKGKRETWELAKRCGLSDGIAKIAEYFDISDVAVIGCGEMAYVDQMPRKYHRVEAVPAKIDYKQVIAQTKQNRRVFK